MKKLTSSRGWSWGPRITSPSHSARASWWRASKRYCVAARKNRPDDEAAVTVHDLVIHPGWHEVLLAGKPIELTFTEFRLLHFLARKPGWAFHPRPNRGCRQGRRLSRHRRSVDVQVAGLRKKLGTYGEYIETVRGIGYRFKG